MSENNEVPIACDLTKLTREQRARERELLERFKKTAVLRERGADNAQFALPADPQSLAELGEFLALERLCCPFLVFELRVSAEAVLKVSGPEGSGVVIAAEFVS